MLIAPRPYVMKRSGFSLLLLSMALGCEGVMLRRQESPPDYSATIDPTNFTLGKNTTVGYTIDLAQTVTNARILDLLLLQTHAVDNEAISITNVATLAVVLPGICVYSTHSSTCTSGTDSSLVQTTFKSGSYTLSVGFNTTSSFTGLNNLNNLFLCWATSINSTTSITGHDDVCYYYSNMFNMVAVEASGLSNLQPTPGVVGRAELAPTGPIRVTSSVTNLVTLLQSQTAVTVPMSAGTAIGMSPVITSITSTSQTTITQTPTSSSASAAGNSKTRVSGGGLSVGAKVGIALGALIGLGLVLLAILFCLRRKHAKRAGHRPLDPHQPPEQVMLTRSMHTDSFGTPIGNGTRGIMAEKEEAVSSAAALHPNSADNSPIHPHQPDTRHSAVAPYVPLPSLPYSGTAATVPRRKPTTATVASTVSRNISSASGPISPGSTATPGEEFSPYHDRPVYGDARHSPQVFQGGERAVGGASSPFVTEEMSPEEVARLEEEERRIDAAIAEAERR